MRSKWLQLLAWYRKRNEARRENGAMTNADTGRLVRKSQSTVPMRTEIVEAAPYFRFEMLAPEGVYDGAGVPTPQKGYGIKKVAEMLGSQHICGLSNEVKRVAVLMALDTAGVSMEEVLQDAKARQEALDGYERLQRIRMEAEWRRKSEENARIEVELDREKALCLARIRHNQNSAAREKAIFDSWMMMKQDECRIIAAAIELYSRPPVREPEVPAKESREQRSHAARASAMR